MFLLVAALSYKSGERWRGLKFLPETKGRILNYTGIIGVR